MNKYFATLLLLLTLANSLPARDCSDTPEKYRTLRLIAATTFIAGGLIYPNYAYYADGRFEGALAMDGLILTSAIIGISVGPPNQMSPFMKKTYTVTSASAAILWAFYPFVEIVQGYSSGDNGRANRGWLGYGIESLMLWGLLNLDDPPRCPEKKKNLSILPIVSPNFAGLRLNAQF